MKKIKSLFLISLFLLTASVMTVFAGHTLTARAEGSSDSMFVHDEQTYEEVFSYKDILFEYYIDFIESSELGDFAPTFDEFHDAFYGQDKFEIYEFTEYLKKLAIEDNLNIDEIDNVVMRGSLSPYDPMRCNIGTGPLPCRPNYGLFELFDLKPGDILFDENGISTGTSGISGHTGIIEGRFLDPNYGYYWRTIESYVIAEFDSAVSRHLLDDTRFINQKGHILRVNNVTDTTRQGAVDFAVSQLGKAWGLQLSSRPTSSNIWMCSTLVWASYKNQGIDLSPGASNAGVFPTNIFNSSLTTEIVSYHQPLSQTYNTSIVNGELQIDSPTFTPTGTLTIPPQIGANSVSRIGANAFAGYNIVTVFLPNTVNFIGSSAFSAGVDVQMVQTNAQLVGQVTIPNGVTSIAANALARAQLSQISIPPSVKSIGDFAFTNCGMTDVIFEPNSQLTSIGAYAFYYCSSLNEITIPKGVTSIGSYAFAGCTNLSTINFNATSCHNFTPESNVFLNAGSSALNIEVNFGDDVARIPSYLFYNFASKITSITIPKNVKNIGDYAFSGCYYLTTINFNAANMNDLSPNNNVFSNMGGSIFSIEVNFGEDVNRIPAYLFYNILSTVRITDITIAKNVKSIGDYAFYGCKRLSTINFNATNCFDFTPNGNIFPSNLTQINFGMDVNRIPAYLCYNAIEITDITIPVNIKTIGDYAFFNCSRLTDITIPNSVTTIGFGALEGCYNLTSVTLPFTGGYANWTNYTHLGFIFGTTLDYEQNSYLPIGLKTVTITGGVTSIGSSAFYGCTSLTNITIPEGVTNIGYFTFYGCTSLTNITIPESVTSIEGYAFYGCTGLTEITIPNSTTYVGDSAFSGCTNLTKVTILGNITYIGDYAFYDCESLDRIEIPARITEIGAFTFAYCTSLTTVNFESGSALNVISEYSFYYCESLSEIIIPANVIEINAFAFSNCHNLTTVTFESESELTAIGDYAFWYCESLTGIIIPAGITYINSNAFAFCSGLNSIIFEQASALTTIGDYAFWYCESLTGIMLPANVSEIGENAFLGCYNLINIGVDIYNNSYSSLNGVLFNKDQTLLIIYPNAKEGEYIIPSSVTSISPYAFRDCAGISSITFEEGSQLTIIGTSAFFGCESLVKIIIPMRVTEIGEWAFYYCTSLTFVTFEEGSQLTTVNNFAFASCESLTEIIIPAMVTKIGNLAFSGCANLTLVEFESINQLEIIGTYAFASCESLTEINIPASVWEIGANAFNGCTDLTHINVSADNNNYSSVDGVLFNKSQTVLVCYPGGRSGTYIISDSVTSIENNAFAFCIGLTEITISAGVTEIGASAFNSCINLSAVIFETGSQLNTIGDSAFYGCKSLHTIILPDGLTYIDAFAFSFCTNLTEITIPSSIAYAGDFVFCGWTSDQIICIQGSVSGAWSYGWDWECEAQIIYIVA